MIGVVEIGATKDYILDSKAHMELALAIEAAMPAVRKARFEEIFENLRTELLREREAEWEIRSNPGCNPKAKPWIGFRKKIWPDRRGATMPVAVVLQANVADELGRVYLGVYCEGEDAGAGLPMLQEAAKGHLGDRSKCLSKNGVE